MHYVIYLDDNKRLAVANRSFQLKANATRYANTVAKSRNAVVVTGSALTRVCDNPHCYFYGGHMCTNSPDGREEMGAECALNK